MIVRFCDSSDSTILPSETLEMIDRFCDSSNSTILPSDTFEMIVRFCDSSDSTILPSETLEMIDRFCDSSNSTILPSDTFEMIVRFCDSSDSTILPSDTLEMIVRFFRFYDFAFRDFRNDVEICASSFESRSDVYNFMHRELDMEVLSKLENFSRLKGNNLAIVWKLNADRVEECYFLYKTVNLFGNNGFLYLLNVKQADVEGKRRIKFRGNLSRVMEIDL